MPLYGSGAKFAICIFLANRFSESVWYIFPGTGVLDSFIFHTPTFIEEGTMTILQKSSEKPAQPGEYIERDPNGSPVPDARQVTIEPGDDKLPPTQKEDRKWEWIGPPES